MSDLKKEAEALGIDVDGRWSDETLKEEIEKARKSRSVNHAKAEEPKKSDMIPVRINRDFWDDEGTRHRKGTVVEVPVEAALDGVESGTLSRVKK